MEVELANILFSWLLHIDMVDLACIVCNSDGTTWSGGLGATGAAAGGLSLSNLFGPNYDLPTLQIPGGDSDNPDPGQAVPPGSPPPLPSEYADRSDTEGRVAAEEAARQRGRDARQLRHPEDTTAPPAQPTIGDQAEDTFYHTVITLGTR